MAQALERVVGAQIDEGLVVVKRGHAVPTKHITLLETGHPIPDEAGERAARRVLALLRSLEFDDLVLVLVSGGASSLLPLPAGEVTLVDKQVTTDLLLRSGASIQEINTVRKHLSAVKGGRLAVETKARVIGLLMSDVLGDDVATIGSGLTAPDPTTYHDAKRLLIRRHLWKKVPRSVRQHLTVGIHGLQPETPKPGDPRFRRVRNIVLGNNRTAVDAVVAAARRLGLRTFVVSDRFTGEADHRGRDFGRLGRSIVAQRALIRPPCLAIAGGELTVTVKGEGRGGRAQEFALAAAQVIDGLPDVWVCAFGTDGTDGPTDVAGAVVDGHLAQRARALGLDLAAALRRHDSYSLLKKLGAHIVTGPTGTNVNDLYLLLAL
jgi:glycerate-2-kinase